MAPRLRSSFRSLYHSSLWRTISVSYTHLLYNIEGSYERFLVTLNRAFEASGFQREMLFLTDEQLEHPDRELDRILMERTPSLQILRKQFAGRVIHRSVAVSYTHLDVYKRQELGPRGRACRSFVRLRARKEPRQCQQWQEIR